MDWIDAHKFAIAHHRLMIDEKLAPWRATPNVSRDRAGHPLIIKPEVIVMHETASGLSAAGDIAWLCNPAARVSAHVVIGRDATVTQLAPFNQATWHAFPSKYQGRNNVNRFSIGIELDGPGKMVATTDGQVRAWFGEEYSIARHDIARVKTPEHGDGWWMPFTDPQIHAATALCKALVDAYGLADITTHWAVSPRRKVDPNPLFPIYWVRKLALPEALAEQPMGRA